MSDPVKRTISGSVVKRTTDGTVFELHPTDAGQLRLQNPDAEPGDGVVTMDPGQFQLQIRGGEYYFPNGNTAEVMDAIREYRERRP